MAAIFKKGGRIESGQIFVAKDQTGNRNLIIATTKTGFIVLNAGIAQDSVPTQEFRGDNRLTAYLKIRNRLGVPNSIYPAKEK